MNSKQSAFLRELIGAATAYDQRYQWECGPGDAFTPQSHRRSEAEREYLAEMRESSAALLRSYISSITD